MSGVATEGFTLTLRSRNLVLLALAGTVSCASAQSGSSSVLAPRAFNPLKFPDSTFLCGSRSAPARAPHGSVSFDFEDGRLLVDDRLIGTVYDSVGAPRLLVLTATEKVQDSVPVVHVVSVSFPSGQPATGFEVIRRIGDEGVNPPRKQLSAESLSQSGVLARWLWRHRCREDHAPAS